MVYTNRILEELQKKNLKMCDLANALEINKSVISAWKKRQTNPPLEYLVQICKFIDMSPNELLDYEDYSQNELIQIYNKLSPEDKAIVDIIFDKYKSKEVEKLSDFKIR